MKDYFRSMNQPESTIVHPTAPVAPNRDFLVGKLEDVIFFKFPTGIKLQ